MAGVQTCALPIYIRAFGVEAVDENGDDVLETNPYQGTTVLNSITVTHANNVFNFSYSPYPKASRRVLV